MTSLQCRISMRPGDFRQARLTYITHALGEKVVKVCGSHIGFEGPVGSCVAGMFDFN